MGGGDEIGEILAKGAHGLAQARLAPLAEVIGLGIAADEEGQADVGQRRAQGRMPERRAFRPGRGIPASRQAAGIAEPDADECYAPRVVEDLAREPEPRPQALARGIVPRHAGLVHLGSRRLSANEKPRRGEGLEDRARAERQMLGTDPAGADAGEECREARASAHRLARSSPTKRGTTSLAGP